MNHILVMHAIMCIFCVFDLMNFMSFIIKLIKFELHNYDVWYLHSSIIQHQLTTDSLHQKADQNRDRLSVTVGILNSLNHLFIVQ